MLSNPYPYDISWHRSFMQVPTGNFDLNTMNVIFQDDSPVAYVVNSATGGYTPVAYTPGIGNYLKAGEGFYIRLSNVFDGIATCNLGMSVEK